MDKCPHCGVNGPEDKGSHYWCWWCTRILPKELEEHGEDEMTGIEAPPHKPRPVTFVDMFKQRFGGGSK